MDAQEQGRGIIQNPDAQIDKDAASQVVSAARRRVLKAGLITVPIIFTLRSKPVFGADPCAGGSLSLSAAQSHGVELPPCEQETVGKPSNGGPTESSNSNSGQPSNGGVGQPANDGLSRGNDPLGRGNTGRGNDNRGRSGR